MPASGSRAYGARARRRSTRKWVAKLMLATSMNAIATASISGESQ